MEVLNFVNLIIKSNCFIDHTHLRHFLKMWNKMSEQKITGSTCFMCSQIYIFTFQYSNLCCKKPVEFAFLVSSPPVNLRAGSITATKIKIVWEKPTKICGHLKGYYVQEAGKCLFT